MKVSTARAFKSITPFPLGGEQTSLPPGMQRE
jgi:hypothetical protein